MAPICGLGHTASAELFAVVFQTWRYVTRFLTPLDLFLKPKMFQQLRAELAAIWSPREDWRFLRRMTKRAKRRALLYGELLEQELEPKHNPEDDEDLSMKVLFTALALLCTLFPSFSLFR
jgi:hypothetical protein